MHKQWEELIPFYIAQTLPASDAAALERHLSTCLDCRHSLEEWRAIAGAVRLEAASHLRDLPPPLFLQRLGRQAAQRPAGATILRFAVPASVAAAAVVALVSGVIMIAILARGLRPIEQASEIAVLPTETPRSATETVEPTITATPAPTDVTPTSAAPIAILPPTVQSSPTRRVVPTQIPPTQTFSPPPTQGFAPEIGVQENAPLISPPSMELSRLVCNVRLVGDGGTLYSGAGFDYAVVTTISAADTISPIERSDNGWVHVEVSVSEMTWTGWIRAEAVIFDGDCSTLPLVSVAANTSPQESSGLPLYWSNTATVVENTCGITGSSFTSAFTIVASADGTSLDVTNVTTGMRFTLYRIGDGSYSGSYSANGTAEITLNFISTTGYAGYETMTTPDGCVVRSAWVGMAG